MKTYVKNVTLSSQLPTLHFRLLSDVSEADEIAKDGNNELEWRPDGCDQEVTTEHTADFEDRLDTAAYNAGETTDEATAIWAANVAGEEHEASASGWVGNGCKSIDTTDSQWNGTSDQSTKDSRLDAERRSRQFTASVVVNTGTKDRCKSILN